MHPHTYTHTQTKRPQIKISRDPKFIWNTVSKAIISSCSQWLLKAEYLLSKFEYFSAHSLIQRGAKIVNEDIFHELNLWRLLSRLQITYNVGKMREKKGVKTRGGKLQKVTLRDGQMDEKINGSKADWNGEGQRQSVWYEMTGARKHRPIMIHARQRKRRIWGQTKLQRTETQIITQTEETAEGDS